MKGFMKPREIAGGVIFYETAQGLAVGRRYASYTSLLPWRSVRAALKRHEAGKRKAAGAVVKVRWSTWRVGSKVPINVYDGDRPVCQCQTAIDAQRIVLAMNTVNDFVCAVGEMTNADALQRVKELVQLAAAVERAKADPPASAEEPAPQ
jgi:hypothetical protein